MHKLGIAVAASVVLGAATVVPASAMPISNLAAAASTGSHVEDVVWVCGPYRCRWLPAYSYSYYPRAYGYRYFAPGYGYRYAAWPYSRFGYRRFGW